MIYDDTDIIWCHDKLTHWLPESDIIELTDKFQLVNNFHSIWNIKSAVSKVTDSKTFLSHNVILHSSSRRTLKFTFNQTLLSRDFSILFRLSKLSNFHKQKTASLQRPVRQLLPSLYQQINSRNWELAVCFWTTPEFQRLIVSHHQTGLNISKVACLLIIPIAVVNVDASLAWLSVPLKMWLELVIEIILVIVIVSFWSIILVIISF